MNKIIIQLNVSEQSVKLCDESVKLLTDSQNLYYLHFNFSALWTGNRHCQLKKGDLKADYTVTENVLIPREMTKTPGQLSVSVYTENRITSTSAKLSVIPSDYDETLTETPQEVPEEGEGFVKTTTGKDTVSKLKTEGESLLFWNGTSWKTLSGGGAVRSVNGKTGAVVLTPEDLSAVRKETGKGLSSNDYTDSEKEAVSQISSKAATGFSVSKPTVSGLYLVPAATYTPLESGTVIALPSKESTAMLFMKPVSGRCETFVATAEGDWLRLLTEKDRPKPSVKSLITDPLEKNTLYLCGTLSEAFTLRFPKTAEKGDFIYLSFEIGETLPTVTVDKTDTFGLDGLAFERNTAYELHGLYDGVKWNILYSEAVIL